MAVGTLEIWFQNKLFFLTGPALFLRVPLIIFCSGLRDTKAMAAQTVPSPGGGSDPFGSRPHPGAPQALLLPRGKQPQPLEIRSKDGGKKLKEAG